MPGTSTAERPKGAASPATTANGLSTESLPMNDLPSGAAACVSASRGPPVGIASRRLANGADGVRVAAIRRRGKAPVGPSSGALSLQVVRRIA